MKTYVTLLGLLLLSFALTVSSVPGPKKPPKKPPQKPVEVAPIIEVSKEKPITQQFDQVILAQQWRRTGCCSVDFSMKPPKTTCNPKCPPNELTTEWSIHGLWPTDSQGKSIENCPSQTEVSFGRFPDNLIKDLEKYWSSTSRGKSNTAFWRHEWKKHGTCAITLKGTDNHLNYFNKAITLIINHNVGKKLKLAGIIPGNTYTLTAIENALKKLSANPHKVVVRCLHKQGRSYLQEVHVCYGRDYFKEDCKKGKSNCDKDVVYP